MKLVNVAKLAVCLLPCGVNAQTHEPLSTLAEARSWYISMMRENGCAMNALEIREAIEAAFPYADVTRRESSLMMGEVAMELVSEGLIVSPYLNTVEYVGKDGC
ncbi:MAG: hypothetical protein ACSHW1_20785 [Yoonia sp.]|uniref:hypothetical protein n=1 Tax=Yoonia sp. TaxID=2212373 RepID=UPI003EF40A37